jgi:hypothetical protein
MSAEKVTALARVETARPIEPTTMGELERLCAAAAKTGFFGAKSPEQALLVAMSGRDLGLSYSQALRAFHVIEGKPTLSADGMVAACLLRRDVCEYFRTIESTNERATVETKRSGQPSQKLSFSLDDATRAGLAGKHTWAKYPSRMLLARARAALARDVYPDLLLGLYDPDEVEAAPPARVEVEVRPPPPPAKPPAQTITSVTSDGEVVGDPDDGLMGTFKRGLADASSKEEVTKIGRSIARSGLSREQRADLQPAYIEAMKRVSTPPPPKSSPPPPPEREPGDDAEEEAERAEAYFAGREGAGQ